jgi:N-formylglutamate amidohydrolase
MPRRPFRLHAPRGPAAPSPIVVASPHSGRRYDPDFMSRTVLDAARIRSSEDAFVDLLLDDVPALRLPLLCAEMPRAFVDLNRAATELDPAVVQDVPRAPANPRVSSGLGVIPRVVGQGRAIYSGKISRVEARERIERYWHPYHDALDGLLDAARARWGRAVLLDVHSMPREAIEPGPAGIPEVVLGDRFGASARPELMDRVEAVFAGLGLRVARNAPFAGAYVLQRHGRPADGRCAIQIEIDRSLYMDEASVRPGPRFDEIRDLMGAAIAGIRRAVEEGDGARMAAE